MVMLYGIKNCDTIRKARRWLADNGIEYRFHDFRADGISAKLLAPWVEELGWETLINRRGTTWRQLPAAQRDALDRATAVGLMLDHPTLIKRPVLEIDKRYYLGFKDEQYSELFS